MIRLSKEFSEGFYNHGSGVNRFLAKRKLWKWVHAYNRIVHVARFDIWWPFAWRLWGKWTWKDDPPAHPMSRVGPNPARSYRAGK